MFFFQGSMCRPSFVLKLVSVGSIRKLIQLALYMNFFSKTLITDISFSIGLRSWSAA